MADDKEIPPVPETESSEKPSITEGVSGRITSTISSLTESMKEAASSVAAHIKSPVAVSNRVETSHPIAENFDAPPMTAEEIAEHAAADTQPTPAKKVPRKKRASPDLSGRITPTYDIPLSDKPMPSAKKRKAAGKKPTKRSRPKKSAKKTFKKTGKKIARKIPKKNAETTKAAAKKKKAKRGR